MNNIPNEILQHIFTYLSQRYISICSTVCQRWFTVIRDPQFYKIIHLYSEKQLKKFLSIASTLKITKKNIPIGHFVNELNIKDAFYGDTTLNSDQLQHLYISCPNLTKIDDLSFALEEENDTFPCWPYLTTIPFWCSTLDRSLSSHHHHDTIVSLEYKIENNTNNNNNNDYSHNNTDVIQLCTDQRKRYRPAKEQSLFSIFHERPPINNEGYIEHYGKTIFFFSPPSWYQLKSLSLQFNAYNNGSNTAIYELDERVLETIHATCPQLVSLTLKDFFMNLSDSYLSTKHHYYHHQSTHPSPSPSSIPSQDSLKELHLIQCCLHDVLCFDYLSTLYPHVTTLTLHLLWNDSTMINNEPYKLSILNMITRFNDLKRLSASLKYVTNFVNVYLTDELWPDVELYQWLLLHPTQLEALEYPYDLLTIEHRYLAHMQSITATASSSTSSSLLPYHYQHKNDLNPYLAYLHHLTSLTLMLEKPSSDVLHYLLLYGTSDYISLSITSLTLLQDLTTLTNLCNNDDEDDDFFIDQWLDAFPHLKKLDLQFIGNIKLKKRNQVNVHDNDIDHYVDKTMGRLSLMDQQQQQQQQQQRRSTYVLEELAISGAYIYIDSHELKLFFESFPSLRSLTLHEINFIYPTKKPTLSYLLPPLSTTKDNHDEGDIDDKEYEEEEEEEEDDDDDDIDDDDDDDRVNYMIIDISHLHLDKLELSYLRQGKSKYISYERRSVKLIVNELSSRNTFQIIKKTTLYPTVNIIVHCKSVDTSLFKTL